jgi:DMSO/TMAO reductase YedYZ molybdopterin-dependent catalytic subunit
MRRRLVHGGLVGILLTALFVAVSYIGWKLAGLPFVPFDLFDWAARELPGSLVTLAIDGFVALGPALGLQSIGATAKFVEQVSAIAATIGTGAALGSLLFAALDASKEPARVFGAVLGTMLGAAALAIERSLQRLTPDALAAGIWIVGSGFALGFAFGWVCDRLREPAVHSAMASPAMERRRFLVRLLYATGTPTFAVAIWGLVAGRRRPAASGARWSDGHALPNAAAAVQPLRGTRPELTPLESHYRIDANTRVPVVDSKTWRLQVAGRVERPLALTLDDLQQDEPVHQFVTLSCISNPIGGNLIGTTRWTGVSLQRLIERFELASGATHLKIVSADGFFEVVSLDLIRRDPRAMLAYAWDGIPLAPEHGFPLRVYLPDVYGMKQPKWIVAIHAVDRWEPGYWVMRGWDREGQMKATSVIDVVQPRGRAASSSNGETAEAGGIAHAGARGVSRVELRVDTGDWQPARLRDPLSDTAWVVWRANLTAEQGEHQITVRCYEGDGTLQQGGFHAKRISLPG